MLSHIDSIRMPAKSGQELISEAKKRIREVSAKEALELQARGAPVVYLDIREQNEWNLAHLPRATFLPRGLIEGHVEQRVPRDTSVIVYCASGNRSALVADTMQEMGYTDVRSMAGGIRAWVDAGGEVED